MGKVCNRGIEEILWDMIKCSLRMVLSVVTRQEKEKYLGTPKSHQMPHSFVTLK